MRPAGPCVIRGAAVLDGLGGPPTSGWTIVSQDERIRYAGPDRPDLEAFLGLDQRHIHDLQGHMVLPGLINLHEHLTMKRTWGPLWQQMDLPTEVLAIRGVRAALADVRAGITTVRELGAKGSSSLPLRYAIESGIIPGPRMLPAGAPLSITGGHSHRLTQEVDGADGVRLAVRRLLKQGAEWIKLIASNDPIAAHDGGPADRVTGEYTLPEFTFDEMHAACDEAHNWGKNVAIHCMGKRQIRNAVLAGADSIEHGVYLDEEIAALMLEHETVLVPTLSGYRETLSPAFDRGAHWVELHEHLVEPHFASIQVAVSCGVRIGVGTDTVGDFVDEIQLLIRAGLDPHEALRGATAYAAELLGLERLIGTIEAGKIADLVAIVGDPLVDQQALRRVALVVQRGRCSQPSEIMVVDSDETATFNSLPRGIR